MAVGQLVLARTAEAADARDDGVSDALDGRTSIVPGGDPEHQVIAAHQDATGSIDRACDLIARAPKDFALYSGDDMTMMAFILLGGHGTISVTANVAPRLMHEVCAAALQGDAVTARAANAKLVGLHRDLFCEANPIPVKWAVEQMGLIGPGIRLPLTRLSESCHERVRKAMRQAGIEV